MVRQLKTIARAVAPPPVRRAWGRWYGQRKIGRARRAFDAAAASAGDYLPLERLSALMTRGYRPPDAVRYDPEGLRLRAEEKVARLDRLVGIGPGTRVLELGCWDGMVAGMLAARGADAYGLDIVADGVDRRAVGSGARFVRADAAAIPLRSESIDLVVSFGSLEHFSAPDRCLREVARVLKSGGHACLQFGPLYWSPYGRHAYRQIPVPFCHILFAEETLRAWSEAEGLPHRWPYVNGWTLGQYRGLWQSAADRLQILDYQEHTTGGVGAELVAEFPHHFRRRVSDFQDLLVGHVDVLLRKR